MKARILCFEADAGMAANVGGPVVTRPRTFDVELPDEIGEWLNGSGGFINRGITGVEILAVPAERGQKGRE